ncbi:hypothetical protein P154DRAFT_103709 [Amniculicola lignicola CBS 123094]|uniref:Extracellular membrane protein CFEM domain-containing protein n=1 Tax=Amniculicola lignicola CBS 123094 TaxID=1392246 RepID=A0A6A5WMY2_9PLEO|nr:hypothetical protein P154DRAFT_103709 [Amniculicola lignicola CBS 123094]
MLSSVFHLLVLALGLVAAHGFDWIDGQPDCMQECLSETRDGCDSAECVCDAAQDDSYLIDTMSCAASKCEDTQAWYLKMSFIYPLQTYCFAVGNEVPEEIISSACEAASGTTTETSAPFTTHKVQHSQKSESPKTNGGHQLTKFITTTMTQTKTDDNGNTLQIIIPFVMGPSTTSYGKPITSTLDGKDDSSTPPASSSSAAAASPSSTPQVTPLASTQPPQGQVASSTTSSTKAQQTSKSNGSPFENMQAGASQWSVPRALIGMGVLAGGFMLL